MKLEKEFEIEIVNYGIRGVELTSGMGGVDETMSGEARPGPRE